MPFRLFSNALVFASACLLSFAVSARERYMAEIPNACELLPSTLAQTFLGQAVAERSKEHIGDFYSQCFFKGIDTGGYMVGFDFKFITKEMFDTDALPEEMIDFPVRAAAAVRESATRGRRCRRRR